MVTDGEQEEVFVDDDERMELQQLLSQQVGNQYLVVRAIYFGGTDLVLEVI